GRLTRAIGSEKTIDTSSGNQQIKIVDRDLCSETAAQPARFDQVLVFLHQSVNASAKRLLTAQRKIRSSLPVVTFQRTTDALPLPLATVSPSGENASEVTVISCPFNVRFDLPEVRSQRMTVRSSPPLARVLEPGEKASALTTLSCFLNSLRTAPLFRSHKTIERSARAVASNFPDASIATAVIC